MFILGRTQMASHLDYDECLKAFSKAGYDGAEISVLDINFKVRNDFFSSHTLKKIIETVKQTEIKQISVSCHMDYINEPENMEIIKKTMPAAKKLGAEILIINGAFRKSKSPDEERREWDLTVEKTSRLCQTASSEGITLAVEFEPGFVVGSTEQLLKLFHEVDHPHLKANLDLGHVFLCDPAPMSSINRLGTRIAHCHIENMKRGVHDHLLPDEGDMDLGAYVQQLKQTGYKGALALDLYKYDYLSVSPRAVAYLKALVR